MALKIEYAPYSLKPKKALSSLIARQEDVSGVLLRMHFSDGIGYSVLQTWPSLNQVTLKECLNDLSTEANLDYSKSAIYFAGLDKDLRNKKESAYKDLLQIENYISLGELNNLEECPEGSLIKWKWPKDSLQVIKNQTRLMDFSSRVDLNFLPLSKNDYEILNSLPCDYVEDPADVEFLKHSVAWDHLKPKAEKQIFIVKPIKEAATELNLLQQRRVIFTSNMDHPLGQMQATVFASNFYKANPHLVDICGLNTASLFETNAYAEALEYSGHALLGCSGTGFGFDDLLGREKWILQK